MAGPEGPAIIIISNKAYWASFTMASHFWYAS